MLGQGECIKFRQPKDNEHLGYRINDRVILK
jgi:hypothetical protein